MNHIQAIQLENVVYFKDSTRFEFEPGVTFIQGRNLQRRGPQASNGSGKSLLFGLLPNLLFDTHATIVKNSRSVARQLFGKTSTASVQFTQRKHEYVYTKAGSKTSLSRDGKDLQSRIARDQLKSLIDLSEEEFFSTVYLDSRRNNGFQMGTSAERFAFVTELFRLQDIDALRLHASRSITELRGEGNVLDALRGELADARITLKALPRDAQAQADAASAWLKTASLRAQRLTSLHHQWSNYNRWSKENALLEAMPRPELTAKALRAAISELDVYDAEMRQYRQQQKAQKGLRDELAASNLDVRDYDAMLQRKNSVVHVDAPEIPEGDSARAERIAARAPQSRAVRIQSRSKAQASLLQNQLDVFNSEVGESDRCPTCHSELSVKTKTNIRKNFETQIAALHAKAKTAAAYILAHETVAAHTEYATDKVAYKAYKVELQTLQDYPFKGVRRQLELKTMLSGATVLEKPATPLAITSGQSRETLEASLVQAQRRADQVQVVKALQVDIPDAPADEGSLAELNALVSTRMGTLPVLQAQASERKLTISRIAAIKIKIAELDARLSDLPVYQLLVDAYSTKGIKMLMVQRIAQALEKNLNLYSRQIFAEDFKFSFAVVDGKFDVNVTRKMGRREITSDIRNMSGAESRLFVFLFVLSLLPLIPDRRRMNILVLDEPDNNMDEDTLNTFTTVLLPKLKAIVPTVIVISPRDYAPHDAKVFTVVKENGASRLVSGRYKAPAMIPKPDIKRGAA